MVKDGWKVVEIVVNLFCKMCFKNKLGKGGFVVVDDLCEVVIIFMLEIV